MKKLLLVITSLVLIISLGACNNASDYVTRDEYELEINQMWAILEDIGVIEGLNGQREYYIQDNESPRGVIFTKVSAYELEMLGTELDKTNAPSYVLDENDNYISFEQVADLLITKYFDNEVTVVTAELGAQIKLILEVGDLPIDEYMAKITLLIAELSNYDFYIIGGSEIYIQCVYSGTSYIKIPVQTLRSSFITMNAELIYQGLYEIKLYNLPFNMTNVQSLYDEYVLNETYTGYVLNYTK